MTNIEKAQEDAAEIRKAKIRRIKAYRSVYGTDADRTVAQQIVWNDMMAACYANRPTMVPDKAGHLCPLRTAQAEGKRMLFLEIQEFTRARPE